MGAGDRDATVYSSEHGRLCPDCGQPVASCRCAASRRGARAAARTDARAAKGTPPSAASRGPADGIARVARTSRGRGGKTVTTISGLVLAEHELAQLLRALKQKLGTGGTVEDGVLELQGDRRDDVLAELERRGLRAKRSGG